MATSGPQVPDETVSAGVAPVPATPHAGVAADAGDPHAPVDGATRWRDVAVGAAFGAEEVTAELIGDVRRAAELPSRWLATLSDRGAMERARASRRASAAVQSAVTAVATSHLVDPFVDAQLDRVLRPLVHAVLDDVLLLLEQEPERIQALIRGQRESMVDELVGRIRTGATAGDTAVDRVAYRMLRRGHHAQPSVPPPAAPPIYET
jgi:hypothetical protein